jgi:hypothetical protein
MMHKPLDQHTSPWFTMVCYSETDVGNHSVNAVPVGVNHGELCYASGCKSRCAMLSQWLWIIVNYAQPVVVKHYELYWDIGYELLCDILSRVCGNHDVLCKASGCESLCHYSHPLPQHSHRDSKSLAQNNTPWFPHTRLSIAQWFTTTGFA